MESKKFSVNMTKEALVEFVFISYYTKISGFFSIILGGIGIALFVIGYNRGARLQAMAVYAFIAVLSLIGNPITLYMKAKKQAETSPAYKNPITYEISPEGMTVSVVVPEEFQSSEEDRDDKEDSEENRATDTGVDDSKKVEQQTLEWRNIYRLRLGKKMIAIHTSPIYAFTIPLSELGNDKDIILSRLVQYTEPHSPHISGNLKSYRSK
jgi:hypothetical protein